MIHNHIQIDSLFPQNGHGFFILVLIKQCLQNMQSQSPGIRYRLRFFDQVWHQTTYLSIGNKHFFSKSCHRQTYQNYEKKIAIFVLSKSFFSIKNQRNRSDYFFWEEFQTRRTTFKMKFFENFLVLFKVLSFLKMRPIFVGSVHNFGRSDDDTIQ